MSTDEATPPRIEADRQAAAAAILASLDPATRARVLEPYRLGAWEKRDLELMIQNEHKLYADAMEQLSAERAKRERAELERETAETAIVDARVMLCAGNAGDALNLLAEYRREPPTPPAEAERPGHCDALPDCQGEYFCACNCHTCQQIPFESDDGTGRSAGGEGGR